MAWNKEDYNKLIKDTWDDIDTCMKVLGKRKEETKENKEDGTDTCVNSVNSSSDENKRLD